MTPVVVRFARMINAVDMPGVRKVHAREIPRLGGIVIVVATLGITIPVFALDNDIGEAFRAVQLQMAVFLATAFLIFGIGLLDDLWGLTPRAKFAGQFLAAAAVCGSGVTIDQIRITDGVTLRFGLLALPITLLWIVGITNAVNLIDGLDGLAAGISLMTCGVITAISIYAHRPVMAVLTLALLGSLSGFLVFNFNPAKIFLGDSGSLFLGFCLASASVLTSHKAATIVALGLPVLALGVPILDTMFSMLRRLLGRRSMFAPDREHIHHRLLDRGLDHRNVVLLLYGVTAVVSLIGILMLFTNELGRIVVLVVGLGFLVFVFRASGVISVTKSIKMLRHNQQLARDVSAGRAGFESAHLRLREARDIDEWWRALREAAEALRFISLYATCTDAAGRSKTRRWAHPELGNKGRAVSTTFVVKDRTGAVRMHITAEVWRSRSFESAGRRVGLLGRLLDETDLAVVRECPDVPVDREETLQPVGSSSVPSAPNVS